MIKLKNTHDKKFLNKKKRKKKVKVMMIIIMKKMMNNMIYHSHLKGKKGKQKK